MKVGDAAYGLRTGKLMGTIVEISENWVKVKTTNGLFTEEWPIDSIDARPASDNVTTFPGKIKEGVGYSEPPKVDLSTINAKELSPEYIEALAQKCLQEKAITIFMPTIEDFRKKDVTYGLPFLPREQWTATQTMSYIFLNLGSTVGFKKYVEYLEGKKGVPADSREIVNAMVQIALEVVMAGILKPKK